jgi:hypothetical protein
MMNIYTNDYKFQGTSWFLDPFNRYCIGDNRKRSIEGGP